MKVHCADTCHSANVWVKVRVRVIGLGSALGFDLGLVGIVDFRNSGYESLPLPWWSMCFVCLSMHLVSKIKLDFDDNFSEECPADREKLIYFVECPHLF